MRRRARDLGDRSPPRGREPERDLVLLDARHATGTLATIGELADPPGRSPAMDRGRRRWSSEGSRPRRPRVACSARWTSTSFDPTRSCSRSGSASVTARWTRATTTCSPLKPGSPASSRSPGGRRPRALVPARPVALPGPSRFCLVSWAGSMFEYLMPTGVRPPERSLRPAGPAGRRAPDEYGGEPGVPWGMSESAFNVLDLAQVTSTGVRGARPGPQARAERGPGRLPLCDRARPR